MVPSGSDAGGVPGVTDVKWREEKQQSFLSVTVHQEEVNSEVKIGFIWSY